MQWSLRSFLEKNTSSSSRARSFALILLSKGAMNLVVSV